MFSREQPPLGFLGPLAVAYVANEAGEEGAFPASRLDDRELDDMPVRIHRDHAIKGRADYRRLYLFARSQRILRSPALDHLPHLPPERAHRACGAFIKRPERAGKELEHPD